VKAAAIGLLMRPEKDEAEAEAKATVSGA